MTIRVGTISRVQKAASHLVAAVVVFSALPASASKCESLAALHLTDVVVTEAEVLASGILVLPSNQPISDLPAFCRVAATITPSIDSEIRVELWMPQAGWNGRIEGTGNGGLAGGINYGSLAAGVRLGYAVANTDMGTSVPPGADASVFVDRPERWADWGYRATHAMTVLAKQLVSTYYEHPAEKSYFVGCSTGGEQGLMEAQRFPDDYDGIVSGAAANNRTGVHVGILWDFAMPQRSAEAYLPQAKIAMLAKAVTDACDSLDGVKDGLIADPPRCKFDPGTLVCKGSAQYACLTPAEVETARRIYSGPVDPRTAASLYPGLARGSEMGWDKLAPAPGSVAPAPYAPIFKWVFGADWDWRSFDFDHDVDRLRARLGSSVNATDPDIDAFREHGHKLLVYQGWSDPIVAPEAAIQYYDAVVTRDEGMNGSSLRSRLGTVDSSYRLFMVPGMAHCGGGPGPNNFNALDAVVQWVEKGAPPEAMIASKTAPVAGGGSIVRQRLLCPYPRIARYKGAGSIDDATSYTCAEPVSAQVKDAWR